MNTLTKPLIRTVSWDNSAARLTLPGVLAAMMQDKVAAFTALRPHQRHAWHAFLTQLGTIALLHAARSTPPETEDEWCALLRGLTPDYEDDAPWCLVSEPDAPALLQPPLPAGGLSDLRGTVTTPDSLDMLVTSKNHDLKRAVMTAAEPDDWLYALVTLQTMEGFLGAGNYGISRMNGGFANRPALGLAPPGGPGAHVRRDIRRLLAMGGRPPLSEPYALDGLALIWLRPWDGLTSLSPFTLHPLYIEICRRVRLVSTDQGLAARVGNSKVPRIATVNGGVTGDPWAPVRPDKDGQKTLTVDARGFSYRPLVDMMFPKNGSPSPLQVVAEDDAPAGLCLVARALVRGQGKTEGYHERRVPVSRKVRRGVMGNATQAVDPVAQSALDRVQLAGEMTGVLRFALLALFENGPAKVDSTNTAAGNKAKPFLARMEQAIDLTFFEDLLAETDQDNHEARDATRTAWVHGLLNVAEQLLKEADAAGAKATSRRYRARVAAQSALQGSVRRNEQLRAYFPQSSKADGVPDAA